MKLQWDFRNNSNIDRLVRTFWDKKKVVSGVCHGPMAFTTVQWSTGKIVLHL